MQDIVGPKLRRIYPLLSLQFIDIGSDKLQANLRAANAAGASPDVVLFEGFPITWGGPPQSLLRQSLETLGGPSGTPSAHADRAARVVIVMPRSHNRNAAQAFVEYLLDDGLLKVPAPTH